MTWLRVCRDRCLGKIHTRKTYERDRTNPDEFASVEARHRALERQLDELASRRREGRRQAAHG